MSNNTVTITEVAIENSINNKVKDVTSISSCMGIDDSSENYMWIPTCDAMNDICYGIMDNTSLFVSCNTYNDTQDGKIYAFTSSNDELLLAHVSGHIFSRVFIYENIIIAITTDGKILKIDNIDTTITNDTLQFIDFPEEVIDAAIISNKLWILSPTKLYQINGAFAEIIDTNPYPEGIMMETIVPAIGGDDIILYRNTEQLPVFIRYRISENKFSAFTSATPFTIVNAILINSEVPMLYVYASDTKIRTLKLSDNIGFFDFTDYNGQQWVGRCSYYDGYVYNQYLDLTSGSPKLFLAKSMNGIIFQLVAEEFDYYGDEYGKYCQGNGQSVFISPTMYRIKTSQICGVDYSRYCDIIEVKNIQCNEHDDSHFIEFDVSDTEITTANIIDESTFFVNLKINGKSVAGTKLNKVDRNGDKMIIILYAEYSSILVSDSITADFVIKRIW